MCRNNQNIWRPNQGPERLFSAGEKKKNLQELNDINKTIKFINGIPRIVSRRAPVLSKN